MMSGLRSQREYTITCVSLRSGIASRGMVRMDQMPAATANPTRIRTRNLLRPENSMMRFSMSVSSVAGMGAARRGAHGVLQLGFGIDQEGARRDHALSHSQAAENLNL